jgi:cytochrome c peroxidase
MIRRPLRPSACALATFSVLALAAGCNTPAITPTDAGPTGDGSAPDAFVGRDAFVAADGGVDAFVAPDAFVASDAFMAADAFMAPDAFVAPDAWMPTDAGPDAWMRPPPDFTTTERAIMATLSPLPALPLDPTNPVADDPRAAALGHALFFDARYSGALAVDSDLGTAGQTGRVSCASCHSGAVMADERSMPANVSLGANFHTRNAPQIVNSAYYPWTNWGGRFSTQWELPPAVAENGAIMNSSRLAIAHFLFDHYRTEYEAIFGPMDPAIGTDTARFPLTGKPKPNMMAADGPWELMTAGDRDIVNRIFVNYGMVIAAYMRTLVSTTSEFDRFIAGDTMALDVDAQWGLRVFMGNGRCVSCHDGPALSDGQFHNLGVAQTGPHVPAMDDGRFTSIPPLLSSPLNSAGIYSGNAVAGMALLAGLTNPPPASTHGQFRTASLRDVELSAPYMHSGQFATLEEVVAFYDAGGGTPVSGTRDRLILPLGLSTQDEADLVAFLHALDTDPVPLALRTAP